MRPLLLILLLAVPALGEQMDIEPPIPIEAYGSPTPSPQGRETARKFSLRRVKDIKRALGEGDVLPLAQTTDSALEQLVVRGTEALEKHGDTEGAYFFAMTYRLSYRGFLTRMVAARLQGRDIGDHKPLIQWLDSFYMRLELVLGIQVCKALHLSDIRTFNSCIPIVFNACRFPMDAVTITRRDEYRNHFAEGSLYYGLVPVVVYWLIDVPCMIGTSGIGALLCGPAASVGEYVMGKFIAPKLSNKVFDKACGG